VRAGLRPDDVPIRFETGAGQICLVSFYASVQKLERLLNRQLTASERIRWLLYGSDEDNINLLVTVRDGQVEQFMKIHNYTFFEKEVRFQERCANTRAMQIRVHQPPTGSGIVIDLSH